ncbi:MAG: TRAP transporter fused permease subunit [Planctomycetaceae bacterium]|nr:TRAP transporter fused permease subunit [Planctomycetaceae bacterium]
MIERIRRSLIAALAVSISVFTVYEVNYGLLPPLSQLAIFAMLGLVLCFLTYPVHPKFKDSTAFHVVDLVLSALTVACCTWLIIEGKDLQARAGAYTPADFAVATVGILLVIEATRRSIGLALPLLSLAFLAYAWGGASMPDWLFPHRGYGIDRIAAQTFLGTSGVFGFAMRVMFTYVFLFVVFGAFLEISGATQFIIGFAQLLFGRFRGGPAMVSVLGSGLMGSLSGSAVANAVTTGSFTIPMMRSARFQPHIAAGIVAAAASGGALVPPVMGAGAYMMLELVENVTFLQIATAALVPAILYYLSILLIVFFYSGRVGAGTSETPEVARQNLQWYDGIVFFAALGTLVGCLLNSTPFRAVTYSLEVILLLTILGPRVQVSQLSRIVALVAFFLVTAGTAIYRASGNEQVALTGISNWADSGISAMLVVLLLGLLHREWRPLIYEAFQKAARGGISLVSASACVGIVIGVVTLTGIGTAFPNAIVPLAERSLFLALLAIMTCSIVLGMGLPSAVCYLLMATLIGPVLSNLGVIPLAAHLFIFYFGMMSMVTPPVALAAYASASIADANIMRTGLAAFRFSLVGFTLPYMFIYRPELLLMNAQGGTAEVGAAALQISIAVVGVVALAAGIAGYLFTTLRVPVRIGMLIAAGMLLSPDLEIGGRNIGVATNIAAGAMFLVTAAMNFSRSRRVKAQAVTLPAEPADAVPAAAVAPQAEAAGETTAD